MGAYLLRRVAWMVVLLAPGERAHLPDLLRAALGRPGACSRRPAGEARPDRADTRPARPRRPRPRAVRPLRRGSRDRLRPRLLLRARHARARGDRGRAAGHHLAHRRRRGDLARDRHTRGHPRRGEAKIAGRPDEHDHRARADLGAGVLARAGGPLPLLRGSRRLASSCRAGRSYVRHHRGPARLVRLAGPAVARAGAPPSPRSMRASCAATCSRRCRRTTSARRARRGCASGEWCCATASAARSLRWSRSSGWTSASCWAARCSPRRVFNIPGVGRARFDVDRERRPAR